MLLTGSMARAWTLLDFNNLPGSYPRYEQVVHALVHKYGQASATLAAAFYGQARADVPGRFRVTPAEPAPAEQVARSLGWATRGLRTASPDFHAAQVRSAGVAQKMTLDVGRNTLIQAIQADQRCRGWARVAQPTACSFCALLATRGAVFRAENTADFKAHDRCHCLPVPLFADRYEPPAHVREWHRLYVESTRGEGDKLNAWRRAYEGR